MNVMHILKLEEQHIREAAEILSTAWYDSALDAETQMREENDKVWFVAVYDGRVVGVMCYRKDFSHDANYLNDIVVSEKFRRKGIARTLLQRFVDESRKEQPTDQPYCLSSTDVTNKASIALHTSFGFVELGRIQKLHFGTDEIFFGYKLD